MDAITVVEIGVGESLPDFHQDCERVRKLVHQEVQRTCDDELELDPTNVIRLANQVVPHERAIHVALALFGQVRTFRVA